MRRLATGNFNVQLVLENVAKRGVALVKQLTCYWLIDFFVQSLRDRHRAVFLGLGIGETDPSIPAPAKSPFPVLARQVQRFLACCDDDDDDAFV